MRVASAAARVASAAALVVSALGACPDLASLRTASVAASFDVRYRARARDRAATPPS